jgi:hypothetical protein
MNRAADFAPSVVVDRCGIREPENLDERLAERLARVCQLVQRTGDREPIIDRKLGFAQAIDRGPVPPQRTPDLAPKLSDRGVDPDPELRGLVPRTGSFVREPDQLRAKQRIVVRPTADPHDPSGGLSEPLPSPRDGHDTHRLPIHIELLNRVPPDIPRGLHRPMNVVLGPGIGSTPRHRAVILDADQDHPTFGVGERNCGPLHLFGRDAALELHQLAFTRERRSELDQPHRQPIRLTRLRMKRRI